VRHNRNGLLTSFFDPKALADSVLSLLEDEVLSRRLRAGARRYAEKNLGMADYIAGYVELIGKLTGQSARRAAAR
jgi:glycosyltransferase involved in cell wall biosynthesis